MRHLKLLVMAAVSCALVSPLVVYTISEQGFEDTSRRLRKGMTPDQVVSAFGVDQPPTIMGDPGSASQTLQVFGENPLFSLVPVYQFIVQYDEEQRLRDGYWKRVFLLNETQGKLDIK